MPNVLHHLFASGDNATHSLPSGWLGVVTKVWDAGWPRYKRWRESRKIENKVKILLDYMCLNIEAEDKGRVSFYFNIVNFYNEEIIVNHIEVYSWNINNYGLPEQSQHIVGSGKANEHDIGKGQFAIALHSADVRGILIAMQPARNLRSIPNAIFETTGVCSITIGNKAIKIPFHIRGNCFDINIPNHMAMG